MIKKTDFETKV